MPDELPEPTNDADLPEDFIELPMSLCQVSAVRPLIDAAKAKRRGVLFMSASPDTPNPFWKLKAVSLSQRSVRKILKIVKEELGQKPV